MSDAGEYEKEKGLQAYFDALRQYEKNGNNQYEWLGDFQGAPELGPSALNGITTDPRYSQYEQQALRDLEQTSKDGMSARDLADLAATESQVNRANSGRVGAIQQGMAARGMSGSGMELVAQMQAAQDATERQALASLEKNAQAQEGRRAATAQLGNMAGQLQGRDFQQAAQKAAAQDAIARFNNANRYNTNQMNWQGHQSLANQNVAQNNAFQQNVLGARQGGAQMQYNVGVEAANREAMKNANKPNMFGSMIQGAAAGSSMGPWGAVAGAGAGAMSAMAEGGEVPGKAHVPGDSLKNDTVPAILSPGEIVIPRSIAQLEPNQAAEAAKLFVKLTHLTKGKK